MPPLRVLTGYVPNTRRGTTCRTRQLALAMTVYWGVASAPTPTRNDGLSTRGGLTPAITGSFFSLTFVAEFLIRRFGFPFFVLA